MATKRDDRLDVYGGFVQRLVAAHPLPTITAFSPNAPPIIHYHIDKLYQGMTTLNYERRLCKFESIFRQIDICLLLLRKEAEYRRWEEAKRRRRLRLMLRRGERVS